MTRLGLQLIPHLPVAELIETARAAEEIGYDYCLVADEGLMHDVYVVLGAIAQHTERIQLGPVTNGYTRHPAATAAAMATLQEATGGRAVLEVVAGGTMVLDPLGLPRDAPATVVAETIEICRLLWSGEQVTWTGRRFRLADAQLSAGPQDIPIWVAARGDRMLELSGSSADGVVLMVTADLPDAIEIVERGRASRSDGRPFQRAYIDRLAYTPEMIDEAKEMYSYALMDSPDRLLTNLGLDHDHVARMRDALRTGGPAAVAPMVTDTMVSRFQIAGTPEECRQHLGELVAEHHLDVFIMNVISSGFDDNLAMLREVHEIVTGATAR